MERILPKVNINAFQIPYHPPIKKRRISSYIIVPCQIHTVDGRNPAPVEMYKTLVNSGIKTTNLPQLGEFTGFRTNHQQYDVGFIPSSPIKKQRMSSFSSYQSYPIVQCQIHGKHVFLHNKSLHDEEHQQSWFRRLVEFIQTIFLDAKKNIPRCSELRLPGLKKTLRIPMGLVRIFFYMNGWCLW